MRIELTLAAAISVLTAKSANAWGANGHMTVGLVAMEFLSPNALSFVQNSLGATYNFSLGPAATWADNVRSTAAFTWSAPFHFVDAQDNPPTSCSVSETRDCASGTCILSAIANYTARVVDTTLDDEQRQEALKFVDHFIGDIGQPLHVEAVSLGGNDITAKCQGTKTNLHAVWDSGIINVLLKDTYQNDINVWANTLIQRIKTGSYADLAAGWITCSSATDPVASKRSIEHDIADILRRDVTPLACPLVWASESNAFNCPSVFAFVPGEDLCSPAYYAPNVPIIESQIAKQGFRLAAWLNVLFDGATNLP
ncbi:hypothetical protein D9619_011906 [Psilocybe cf. subviscida]|uniref:Nuclease Le1 n=1 Tax=Psilocybe cf. subviscida TaxID=2480587 RepID=A0A8H5B117_9AGAR|nr:hypothetical protein D9619_011906 [Psilocybe cf. subviscida]